MVELDATMHDLVDRAIRNAAPAVVDALEREAERIHDAARRAWPVKTGLSRDSLDWGIRIQPPDKIEAFVHNTASHARFIKGNAQGGRHTWTVLVRRPMRRKARALADELAGDLLAVARGSDGD